MVHGSEEQKERFLPPIAKAEAVWCQGFSEPGSGSDLASLQTRAVKDGDDYVINGQKIWTSGATQSDWIHILTRTDTDAPKHRGISYFLLDMKTPGIEVRPIIDLAGNHVLNETFFTDVRVPANQMLGEENRGWYVAATLLDFERSGVNYPAQARRVTENLTEWAKNTHRNGGRVYDQPGVAEGLADLALSAEVCRLLSYRVVWMQGQGLIPNYEASAAKMFGTELNQRVANFGINMIGLPGQRIDPEDPDAPLQADLGRMYMTTVPYTIFAGTSEIQRNIIATRGLGLPRQ
jgi:alkylation response protein AidB-like acyl-CoA dehydrogenase